MSSLAYPEGGRTKTITLAADEVATVRQALARYEQAGAKLEAEAEAGIELFRARQHARRQRR